MLSGCWVSCSTKSTSNVQISYQHQLSRPDWLDSLYPLPLCLCTSWCTVLSVLLSVYLPSAILSLTPPPPLTSSSRTLRGIKVWIRQMDRAIDQSQRSILPRLAQTIWLTDIWRLIWFSPVCTRFSQVWDRLSWAWFGLNLVWYRSTLTCLDFSVKR